MSYRSITLQSGETVRISESVLRGAGPQGTIGPSGPPGTATTIRGSVASYANLPANPQQGDSWHVRDTGRLWVWDTTLQTPAWVDAGRIVGPAAVESIGAQRARASALALTSGQTTTVSYTATTYNDPDPLNTGNTDPAVGGVLHASTTATDTVVWPTTPTYYLVTTTVAVDTSVFTPAIRVAWYDTVGASESGAGLVVAPEDGGPLVHAAILKTDRYDSWQLRLTPSDSVGVTSVTTNWVRIGGGSGPEGPVGPAPDLFVGTVTKLASDLSPTFTLTETSPGVYRVDVGLPQGMQGIAGSGYNTMDDLVAGGDSVIDPADGTTATTTDQAIAIPNGASVPSVPWYLTKLANSLYTKLVGRLSSAGIAARGSSGFSGQVVFNTDTNQLLVGQNTTAGGDKWQIVPSIEYGTSSAVYHGAATERPNGSLYFKF